MQPVISVIMPIYNNESRIDIAIKSILNQTFKDFELLLIDDGSKDRSREKCNYYANIDNRVIVIHQENSGVSVARNRGLKEAKGQYINFIDADDSIEIDTFEVLIHYIEKYEFDMVIYGMSFDYYKGEDYLHSNLKVIKDDIIIDRDNIKKHFFNLYDANYLSSSCNKLIKRSLLLENKILFNVNMAILEDLKFTLDIIDNTKTIQAISNPLYRYYNQISLLKLSKRRNLNYINNFNILDIKLRETATNVGLESDLDLEKINGMILRYYLIYLEILFSKKNTMKYKCIGLKEFMALEEVINASKKAKSKGTRFKIVRYLLRNKFRHILFIVLYFNNLYNNIKNRI